MKCLQIVEERNKSESRRQRERREDARKVLNRSIDIVVVASMLVLADEFGFGTHANSRSRMKRYKDALESLLKEAADRYEGAMLEGLRNRLQDKGITYVST